MRTESPQLWGPDAPGKERRNSIVSTCGTRSDCPCETLARFEMKRVLQIRSDSQEEERENHSSTEILIYFHVGGDDIASLCDFSPLTS